MCHHHIKIFDLVHLKNSRRKYNPLELVVRRSLDAPLPLGKSIAGRFQAPPSGIVTVHLPHRSDESHEASARIPWPKVRVGQHVFGRVQEIAKRNIIVAQKNPFAERGVAVDLYLQAAWLGSVSKN